MEKEFVPYDLALELKELGFDESCMAIYSKNPFENNEQQVILLGNIQRKNSTYPEIVTAPLWQQAFRWFIEKHNLNGVPYYSFGGKWECNIQKVEAGLLSGSITAYMRNISTLDESRYFCLKTLIDTVKNGK